MIIANNKIRHNGKLYEKGEPVDNLKGTDVERLLKLNVVSQVSERPSVVVNQPMSVKKLEEYISTIDDLDEIEKLLEQENSSPDPRATAVKVLEKRLQEIDEKEKQEFIKQIQSLESVDELNSLLKDEQESDEPEQDVIDALTKRLGELQGE